MQVLEKVDKKIKEGLEMKEWPAAAFGTMSWPQLCFDSLCALRGLKMRKSFINEVQMHVQDVLLS